MPTTRGGGSEGGDENITQMLQTLVREPNDMIRDMKLQFDNF